MSFIDDLKQQLHAAQEAVKRLNTDKTTNEKKRKEGEFLYSDFKSLNRKLNSAISDFDEKVKCRTDNTPGNFGRYYREQINQGMKKGKIRELDGQANSIFSGFVSRLLDLDNIIEDLVQRISEQNALIRYLKDKLCELGDFVEGLIPGGD